MQRCLDEIQALGMQKVRINDYPQSLFFVLLKASDAIVWVKVHTIMTIYSCFNLFASSSSEVYVGRHNAHCGALTK